MISKRQRARRICEPSVNSPDITYSKWRAFTGSTLVALSAGSRQATNAAEQSTTNDRTKVVGSYVGGFGTGPGLKTRQAKTYEGVVNRWYPGLNGGNYADGFVYNYFNAAWAFVQGLTQAKGDLSKLQASLPKQLRSGYEVSDKGLVKLDANRQAIQDQYPLQIVKNGEVEAEEEE